MLNQNKKKLRTIKIIFLVTVITSVVVANLVHSLLPNNWNVNYHLSVNEISRSNLNLVDKKLLDMEVSDEDFDQKYIDFVNDTIQEAPQIIGRDNAELFDGLSSFTINTGHIMFGSENIENIDNKIDIVLTEVNKIISKAISNKFDYYLELIIEKESFKKKKQLDQLRDSIKDITDIKKNLANIDKLRTWDPTTFTYIENTDNLDRETFLRAVTYNMVFRELQIEDFISQRFRMEGTINNVTTLPSFETLISALNTVYDKRSKDLKTFAQDYERKNFEYRNLLKKKYQLTNNSYLTRVSYQANFTNQGN